MVIGLTLVLSMAVDACGGEAAPAAETPRASAVPFQPVDTAPSPIASAPAPAPALNAPEPTASAGPAPSEGPPAPAPPLDAPAPAALPKGTTILHIGDSFAGALGIDLDRELKTEGVRGILRYETATYIPTWAFGKKLDTYLDQFHPDLVMITLGANELEIPDPAARAPTIHRLVSRLRGTPCVWVLPPLWKGARPALLETIRQSSAPCVSLDSGALVPDLPRARDHIHPSIEARKTWAKAVLEWLRSHRNATPDRPWGLTQ